MVCRYLEKKVEIVSNDNGYKSPMELEYYLLESNTNEFEELYERKVFGIEIVKKVNEFIEKGKITNLFCCREKTRSILDKLACNSVTPVSLSFVIDDLLGA